MLRSIGLGNSYFPTRISESEVGVLAEFPVSHLEIRHFRLQWNDISYWKTRIYRETRISEPNGTQHRICRFRLFRIFCVFCMFLLPRTSLFCSFVLCFFVYFLLFVPSFLEQVIARKTRLWNDLLCVERDVKLYLLTPFWTEFACSDSITACIWFVI